MVAKPSALIDTRVIYCGDNLEQLHSKYKGKPRDWQRSIAIFGPKYGNDPLARFICEAAKVARAQSEAQKKNAEFCGISAFVVPDPKDTWYKILLKALTTGNVKELQHSINIAERAAASIRNPSDPLALQLVDATDRPDGYDERPTLDEFIARYYPHAQGDDSMRRRVNMVSDALGVKLSPSPPKKRRCPTGYSVYSKAAARKKRTP